MSISENFVVDKKGKRFAVMLNIKEYEKLIEMVEELDCIKAYDKAKAKNDTFIPLRKAILLRKKHGKV